MVTPFCSWVMIVPTWAAKSSCPAEVNCCCRFFKDAFTWVAPAVMASDSPAATRPMSGGLGGRRRRRRLLSRRIRGGRDPVTWSAAALAAVAAVSAAFAALTALTKSAAAAEFCLLAASPSPSAS